MRALDATKPHMRIRLVERAVVIAASMILLASCAGGSSCDDATCGSVGSGTSGAGDGAAASPSSAGTSGTPSSGGAAGDTSGSAGTAVPAGGSSSMAGGGAGSPVTSAGMSGGAGNGGMSGEAAGDDVMLALPVVRGDRCVLAFGSIAMEITPAQGGRITSLRLGSFELLTGPAVNAINYGSTFWTSPQADWGWPPIAAIDSAPFTIVQARETECALQGATVAGSGHANVDGVSIAKRFGADLEAQALVVQYTIANEGSSALRLAPWEITRVAPGGLTFYASDGAPSGDEQPPSTMAAGCVWVEHGPSVPMDAKLFGDGKGWLAHVTPDDALLLKVFDDVAPASAATGEAEIELYTGAGYDEIENQGSAGELQPGARRDWTVRWYVRALPEGVARTAGNPDLVAFVESLL